MMKKVLLFHGTDLESAQNILQNGINLKIKLQSQILWDDGFRT